MDEEKILEKYLYRCVVCLDKAVAVHEIDYRSEAHLDPMREDNRVPLCHACHTRVHEEGKKKWKPLLEYHKAKAFAIVRLLK